MVRIIDEESSKKNQNPQDNGKKKSDDSNTSYETKKVKIEEEIQIDLDKVRSSNIDLKENLWTKTEINRTLRDISKCLKAAKDNACCKKGVSHP